MEPTARRLHRLVEPIALVTHMSPEPTEALMALGEPIAAVLDPTGSH